MNSSFCKPALDGSLNILDIIADHGLHSLMHPLFRYVDTENAQRTIYWGEAVKGFHMATKYLTSFVQSMRLNCTSDAPAVVGILANLGKTYSIALLIRLLTV